MKNLLKKSAIEAAVITVCIVLAIILFQCFSKSGEAVDLKSSLLLLCCFPFFFLAALFSRDNEEVLGYKAHAVWRGLLAIVFLIFSVKEMGPFISEKSWFLAVLFPAVFLFEVGETVKYIRKLKA